MHVTDWAAAQREDFELKAVWLESQKKADLRMLLRECIKIEEGQMVWRNCQNFTSLQGTLYLCSTPKGENEDLLLFMVPNRAHDAIEMQDIKPVTVTCPYYKNVSGGQGWPCR